MAHLQTGLGGFADEAIISGHRVLPAVLERTGYHFRHDTAEKALRWGDRPRGVGARRDR